MYTELTEQVHNSEFYYELPERTSDIQLPPGMNVLLLTIWIAISLVGFAVIFLVKRPVAGTVIIAVPTFIGMVIKPTFALSIMMLVLPTGAGVGYKEIFSLDRGVGIALSVSFVLNILISRPWLHIRNKALWLAIVYTIWIAFASLQAPYLRLELTMAFTYFQLLVFFFIIYWILETNGEKTFRWGLRSFVVGTLGTITLAYVTGLAMRSVEEATPHERYAATLGQAIDANMLAALISMAFFAAIYLLARDKNILWRVIYLAGILFIPIMLIRTGSRGCLVALFITLLSPLLFVRQVWRRPALTMLLLVVIVLVLVSTGLLIKTMGLETKVLWRLTDIEFAKESFHYRMGLDIQAVKSAMKWPMGTGVYAWFERTGLRSWPHSDFFAALGLYGIPAAILFSLFMIMLLFTVRRIPPGWEKLYARAVLTFLLVMGLNVGQLPWKYFWAFLAFVIASERIAKFHAPESDLLPRTKNGEDLLVQGELS